MKKLIATITLTLAAAAAPAADAAAKGIPYAGKTKEGTKITFTLDGKWVDRIYTTVPTTCVSAQEAGARATIDSWAPPYKFWLGRKANVTVEEPWPTRNYHIETRGRAGKPISGKLSLNYSKTVGGVYGWRIDTCLGTASFTAKPVRR